MSPEAIIAQVELVGKPRRRKVASGTQAFLENTTTTGVDTQAQFEARGAKPGFKMPKRGGFSSRQEAKRVAAIRKSRQG